MSKREIELCLVLLKETFGEPVQMVGKFLMRQMCPRPLFMICANVPLSRKAINEALQLLLQHDVAEYTVGSRGFPEYGLKPAKVLYLLYHQLYVYHTKLIFGDTAELIIEEFLTQGKLSISSVVKYVGEKLSEANGKESSVQDFKEVRDSFVKIVHGKYLQRAPYLQPGSKRRVPVLSISEKDLYEIPQVNLSSLLVKDSSDAEPPQKKRKVDAGKISDQGIHWKINHERFRRYYRNHIITSAVLSCFDKKASGILKSIFEISENKPIENQKLWGPTTIPVSYHEILEHLNRTYDLETREFDSYLTVLAEDDRGFISKVDDRGGGMYVLNTNKILKHLAEETAASVVQERFGSKASRIFRLLLKKKYLEQKQVEELSMVSPKEAKELTYRMMKECFIITQEISRTPDYAPSRTFYLFHVDINQVSRMLVERCYQAIMNSIMCLEAHRKEQRRLLEKKMKIDAIVTSLEQSGANPEDIEEVQQIITPPEKVLLEKVMTISNKLNRSVVQISEMIFVLKMYEFTNIVNTK